MKKPRVLLAINRQWIPTLLSGRDFSRLQEMAEVINVEAPVQADHPFLLENIADADIVLTSWGTANLDTDIMAAAPRIKLLCHAAGTVTPVVSEELWSRKVRVTSAASAISYGVAEFCLGLMLMASKRVFWLSERARHGEWMEASSSFGGLFELYQQNVGVVGAGHIGKHLIRLLKNFDCNVFAYDPYLTEAQAAELGCQKLATLEELFSTCRAVSLNAPTNEGTRHMLRGHHFAALPPGAVFINTAGSIQIHEEEFLAELHKGQFVACIDRCEIEPCPVDHPYRSLPNVILTPHIAGVAAENRLRIGTFVVDDIAAYLRGEPLVREVTKEKLATMA